MRIIFAILLSICLVSTAFAERSLEYDYELDAYYSNISLFIDLEPEQEIYNAIDMSEVDIYKRLLMKSFSINIILFEASLHPMSLIGLGFRSNNERLYNSATLQSTNLIKAATAGYEEPYSLSFFIGRMMIFQNNPEDRVGKNRAYMGYLTSVGDYSIKDNRAYKNRWINFEYKLKGTRKKEDADLDWSFRVGTKLNSNRDFANSIYIGARRSSIDYKKSALSLLYNSAFSTMLGVNASNYELSEAELTIEKKWPLRWAEKMSFGLALGYLYNSGQKYSGALRDEGVNNHQLIFRPNLTW